MAASTVASAVSKDNLVIPLIDFSHFTSGTLTERHAAATAILQGFQHAGFIYLKNHPIAPSAITSAFTHSAKFFARSKAEKDALEWYSAAANRGYTAQGREKVTDLTDRDQVQALKDDVPDLKESMEIGREGEEGCPNMWPEGDQEGKAFKEYMIGFFDQCKGLHIELMRAVALGLGIEEGWFDGFTDGGDNTLRLLHYPAVEKSVFKREDGKLQVRAGEHSDYGSLTLLFQDARGGLQVKSPQDTFVDATPIPNTIVVNAGDLLARWSNDSIKSTKHRVVEPPPLPGQEQVGDKYPPRYSIAYFCNPNFEKLIEVIPGTYEDIKEKKYESVNSGAYLIQRLEATY